VSTAIQKRDEAIDLLSVDERSAFEKWERLNKPGVNLQYNQRLYEVYLRGIPCEAIALLNPGLCLGQVVKARIDGDWDQRRSQYTADLLSQTNDLVRQTAAESLQFLSLLLAVAHKEQGEPLKRYLATGDPSELKDFRVQNIKSYQAIIQTIAQLIGADQKKTVTHKIVGDNGAIVEEDGIMGAVGVGRLSPKQADAMRLALEKNKDE
jgi:hypothetical protein